MQTQTKESQSRLSPEQALELLVKGNTRFLKTNQHNRNLLKQAEETSKGQFPFAAILSCIDSRTSSELIFDQGMGDVFSIRIAGNIINEDVLGCMEFACKAAGSKLVMVLGHTSCGAVKGACTKVEMGNLTGLLQKIQPSVARVTADDGSEVDPDKVSHINVDHSIDEILRKSPIIQELLNNQEIGLVGAMYNVSTGQVTITNKKF